jgi:hypothetical protein
MAQSETEKLQNSLKFWRAINHFTSPFLLRIRKCFLHLKAEKRQYSLDEGSH